jgi:diphosphomevalonate decarboxylase
LYSKEQIIATILTGKSNIIQQEKGAVYAPANIALCKYWGKRDSTLNLPLTSSLSISLAQKGSHFSFEVSNKERDNLKLNGLAIDEQHDFYQRLFSFINLFRQNDEPHLNIDITSTIPIAAGLASSASGFASVVKGLNILYGWQLSCSELSILARLGSGSACRSLWHGFVEWQHGSRDDGMDSLGAPLDLVWPQLRIGLLLASSDKKSISSREAMAITKQTSPLYSLWPEQVAADLAIIKSALAEKDFTALGETSERNAIAMHATMLKASPAISYNTEKTTAWMQQVWELREDNLPVYFTQDAGPNLKLLFLEDSTDDILQLFPEVEIIQPFSMKTTSY